LDRLPQTPCVLPHLLVRIIGSVPIPVSCPEVLDFLREKVNRVLAWSFRLPHVSLGLT
jgi:hypothetical protein